MHNDDQIRRGAVAALQTLPGDTALGECRVLKKLAPGQRGAKALTRQHGARLVCIRHRADPTGRYRITTVELVINVAARSPRPGPTVALRVGPHERDLRALVKAAGARWDAMAEVWRMRRATAIAMGLKRRIVA